MIDDRPLSRSRQWSTTGRSTSATQPETWSRPSVGLVSSSVAAGVGLFLLNAAGEDLIGLPLAEFGFIALLLLGPRVPAGRTSGAHWAGLWLLVSSMAVLAVTSDVANGFGPFEMAKDSSRLLLLFAPALLFSISARPRWFLGVALGVVLADSMAAGLTTVIALGSGADLQPLKAIFPMPGIILMTFLAFRMHISLPLLSALAAGFLVATTGAVMSGSRNAIASLAIVGGIWVIGSLAPRASRLAIPMAGLMPWFPIALVWTLPVVDFLFSADVATAGNLERSISMLVGRGLIELSPLTGTGLAVFADALNAEMQSIAGLSAPALDPHNFYMQVGVAFGIPAMVLITVTLLAMFRWGFQMSTLALWHRGACLLLLGWIAAITPLAGSSRLEWLALWVILLGIPTLSDGDQTSAASPKSTRGKPFPTPNQLLAAEGPAGRTSRRPDDFDQ